jgi:hypothetical protein
MISIWLLVGAVIAPYTNGIAAPNPAQFATAEACEVVLRVTMEAATHSRLRCVETRVLKTTSVQQVK